MVEKNQSPEESRPSESIAWHELDTPTRYQITALYQAAGYPTNHAIESEHKSV